MIKHSLMEIFASIQERMNANLKATQAVGHPTDKGDVPEAAWCKILSLYLPRRYKVVNKIHAIDSKGRASRQIDIAIIDRQYSPIIFEIGKEYYIPAESIYAVFEVKQSINKEHMEYAEDIISSVRRLHRTSSPIPYAGGQHKPKSPAYIYGGLLAYRSTWTPFYGKALRNYLSSEPQVGGRIDFGCAANEGFFFYDNESRNYRGYEGDKAATMLVFKLIHYLQRIGTVTMMDINEYTKHLEEDSKEMHII